MTHDERRALLEAVREGRTSIADALAALTTEDRNPSVADLGFATLDLQRQDRCGFPEVVYAPGKTPEQCVEIFTRIVALGAGCLATRADLDQAEVIRARFPSAIFDPIGKTIWLPPPPPTPPPAGRVLVVTAGTTDLPVAREACATAEAMGTQVELICDVGVAGLHRVLRRLDDLRSADCLVVVAGMEGALPSVVGGLVEVPVIAVPTSVGYGANLNGFTALAGMLTSCVANVAVVNIDAGFCGGYVAALIARRSIPTSDQNPPVSTASERDPANG